MLADLARRYFATRGPATIHDFAWWSGLTIADGKKAVAILGDVLTSATADDKTYWFVGNPPMRRRTKPEAHLLPNYDEYFIGFRDRSAILGVVKGMSLLPGDPLFTLHVVALDGQIVGGWRRSATKKSVNVEINLGMKPTADARKAIDAAAERYGEFLALPVEVTYT
jgi:hypothetical protein